MAASAHPRRYWFILWFVLLLAAGLVGARLYLNVWLPRYVDDVLNGIEGYEGSVDGIDIALYRGAYVIHGLKLFKTTGHIPVPFIAIDKADLSIQWSALLHGRVVSNVDLYQPVINFAVNPSGATKQTGAEIDWTQPIKDLAPIDINVVTFTDGKLTYRDFSTHPQVNIYIHHMSGEMRNLRNVVDKAQELPSTLIVQGDSIGGGALDIRGRLNILKEVPDMDLDGKLEKVKLQALTDYSNAYASVDIRGGNLSVYCELKVKDSHVSGYVKPIATNVALIDLRKDSNPVKLAWEAVVAVVVELFTNHTHEQFATKIPLDGNLQDIQTDTWSALGGIIRNAFVEAFKKGFDPEGAGKP